MYSSIKSRNFPKRNLAQYLTTGLCLAALLVCDGAMPAGYGQSSSKSSEAPVEDDLAENDLAEDDLFDALTTEVAQESGESERFYDEPDPEDRLSFQDVYDEQVNANYCHDDLCCGTGCLDCTPCRQSRGWFNAGYLLWWAKSSDLPVLATTSSDPNGIGELGNANTTAIFGGSSINGEARGGGKFDTGMWLDSNQSSAVQMTYFFLGEKEESFFGAQDDYPVLARPFFNVDTAAEDARLIAAPGISDGSLHLRAVTELHSSVLAYRRLLKRTPGCRIDYLLGYRFAYLGESVNINHSSTSLQDADLGTVVDLSDSFDTRNTFHGGEIGFELQQQMDHIWSCVLSAKIALGGSLSETQIAGRTTTDDGASINTSSVGLLVQDSNRGVYRETEFNTVSEFGVTLNRRITDQISFTFGYNILLWSHVMRAAEQIDRNVNPTQIPPGTLVGAALPAFPNNSTSYWAHGISFNLEGRF